MSTVPARGWVDVHAHFVTDRYRQAAVASGHEQPDGFHWPAWHPDEHLAMMDRLGIGRSLLSISSPGVSLGDAAEARALARMVNEEGAEVARSRPDRFGHFASLPLPDVDASIAETAYALDVLGSDGVAVMTHSGGRYLGSDSYEPLWAELDRRAAVVFVHPTSPPCWELTSLGRPRPMVEFIFDTARTVTDLMCTGVLERFGRIRWVVPHCGGALPMLGERVEMFRRMSGAEGPSIPELLGRLWYDMAGTPFPHQVPALVAAVGSERILYGSDHCFTPEPAVAAQLASISGAPVPAAGTSWQELTTGNATRLLDGRSERVGGA